MDLDTHPDPGPTTPAPSDIFGRGLEIDPLVGRRAQTLGMAL
jgi:hypothetical protein